MTAREAMHKYLCQLEEVQHIHGFHLDLVREKAEAAILEQKEKDAKIADEAASDFTNGGARNACKQIANQIRGQS
jgi:hypothetical protein